MNNCILEDARIECEKYLKNYIGFHYLDTIQEKWNFIKEKWDFSKRIDGTITNFLSLLDFYFKKDIPEDIKQSDIPDSFSSFALMSELEVRRLVILQSGFVLWTKKWIKMLSEILKNKRCLEICSGHGTLAKYLNEYGVYTIATDLCSDDNNYNFKFNDNFYWSHVEKMDAIKAIEIYGNNVDYIIYSWADIDGLATKALLKMREISSRLKMICIGSMNPDICFGNRFHKISKKINFNEFKEINSNIPQWNIEKNYIFMVE